MIVFFLYTVGVFFERHVFVFIGNIKFDEKCPVDIQEPKTNQQSPSEAEWFWCGGIANRQIPKVGSMLLVKDGESHSLDTCER